MNLKRFSGAALAVAIGTLVSFSVSASAAEKLTIVSAPEGSAFLPYAQGLQKVFDAADLDVEVRVTKGSIENLGLIQEDATIFGPVFLGSAREAVTGTGFAEGAPKDRIRALFPMYETSFQIAVLSSSGLTSVKDLEGKKVGVGPAGGPAERYFNALAEVAGIKVELANGSSTELVDQLASGQIDALWQGAVVPIPALVSATEKADAVVFGLTDAEVAGMREAFPFMAVATIAPGTYKNQSAQIKSISAWNFVMASAELSDDKAYAITKAVLTHPDLVGTVGSLAAGTKADNVFANTVVEFHPGAAKYYEEIGVQLP